MRTRVAAIVPSLRNKRTDHAYLTALLVADILRRQTAYTDMHARAHLPRAERAAASRKRQLDKLRAQRG